MRTWRAHWYRLAYHYAAKKRWHRVVQHYAVKRWRSHWDRLEKLLSEALESLRPEIPTKHAAIVAELIDHSEYGVALEWLTDTIKEAAIEIDEPSRAKLREAARMMKMPWPPR